MPKRYSSEVEGAPVWGFWPCTPYVISPLKSMPTWGASLALTVVESLPPEGSMAVETVL